MSCAGLDENSLQGDRAVLDILERMGAKVTRESGIVTVSGGALRGVEIDARNIPDLVPALCAVASVCEGGTRITGAGRLRIKESDRIESTARALGALGADITPSPDGLIIRGRAKLGGGTAEGFGDHRIVMAAAIASCACRHDVTITGAQAHEKSYPGFFDVFRSLGGRVRLV